ncbi:hypothetical protein MMC10_008913 [Thelotrema lepadinum]|nr:hypothetical protein [Thelotrema lepadinum]
MHFPTFSTFTILTALSLAGTALAIPTPAPDSSAAANPLQLEKRVCGTLKDVCIPGPGPEKNCCDGFTCIGIINGNNVCERK